MDRFPRVSLGRFPTPVEPLRLPGFGGELWIKRDDGTGELYGGNKVRKLEYLLAEARRREARRLITAGAYGSHHALATTAYGRQMGFDVTLVLCPQRPTERVRRILRTNLALEAEIRSVRRLEFIPFGLQLERIRRIGERPFIVAPGGSSVHGVLGYVQAARELLGQVRAGELPPPDRVHVACGTMGTAVGLAVGFATEGAPVQVDAVRVTSALVVNEWSLRRLVRSTLRALARAGGVPSEAEVFARLELVDDQLGAGYGRPTEAGEEARSLFAEAGVELESTYTAKAAAHFLRAVRDSPEQTHLYWHTLSHRIPDPPGSPDLSGVPSEVARILEEV